MKKKINITKGYITDLGKIERSEEITLEKLERFLEKPEESKSKKGSYWFNFMIPYDIEGRRKKDNVKSVSAIMMDYDKEQLSIKDLVDNLNKNFPYLWYLYPTFNNKSFPFNQKGARARIIIPVEEEIPKDDYNDVCSYIANLLDIDFDSTMFSAEHMSYAIVCQDKKNYQLFKSNEQAPFNYNLFLEDIKEYKTQVSNMNTNQNITSTKNIVDYINKQYTSLHYLVSFFPEYYEKKEKRVRVKGAKSDAGVVDMSDGKIFSHHATDPINEGGKITPHQMFDYFKKYCGEGDFKKTVQYLKENNDKGLLKIPHELFTGSFSYDDMPTYTATATGNILNYGRGYIKDLASKPREFIYYPFLPMTTSRYNLFLGESGTGKTTFWSILFARLLKRQSFLGCDFLEKTNDNYNNIAVVGVYAEDEPLTTQRIFKKLGVSEQECENFHYFDWTRIYKYDQNLEAFKPIMEQILNDYDCVVLFWDNWLSTETDNSKNDTESVEQGTKALRYTMDKAKKLNKKCSVTLVHHFNKNQMQQGKDRANGTMYTDAHAGLTFGLEKVGESEREMTMKIYNQNVNLPFEVIEKWKKIGLKIEKQENYEFKVEGFIEKSTAKDILEPYCSRIDTMNEEQLKDYYSSFTQTVSSKQQKFSENCFLHYILQDLGYSLADKDKESINTAFKRHYPNTKTFLQKIIKTQQPTTTK